MYLGRIVAVGMTKEGKATAAYRVSSRSFPNRTAVINNQNSVAILPRKGHESDLSKNPYIAYNCIRMCGSIALATNGSHTDPIIEKITAGMPLRDAFVLSLLALDYEHDSLDTPRIAAAVNSATGLGVIGIVRKDALLVRQMNLEKGMAYYISTYERNTPSKSNFEPYFQITTAAEAAQHMISGGVFSEFEKPVTAAAAVWNGSGYDLAAVDA